MVLFYTATGSMCFVFCCYVSIILFLQCFTHFAPFMFLNLAFPVFEGDWKRLNSPSFPVLVLLSINAVVLVYHYFRT